MDHTTIGLIDGEASMRVTAADVGTPLRTRERKTGTAEQSHTGRTSAAARAVAMDAGPRGKRRARRSGGTNSSMTSDTRTPSARKGAAWKKMPTPIAHIRTPWPPRAPARTTAPATTATAE